MSDVFNALANPARRRMLDLLQQAPGMTINALASHFEFSSVGALKHVNILEGAGLVHSVREGRVRKLYFNVIPIQLVYDRWTTEYSAFWATRLVDLKNRVESQAKGKAARRA